MVIGFFFGLLFLLTGNLLLPMLFHAVMDLRILLILRPPDSEITIRCLTFQLQKCHFYLLFIFKHCATGRAVLYTEQLHRTGKGL